MFLANGKCSIPTFKFLMDELSFPDRKGEIPPIISCVIMNEIPSLIGYHVLVYLLINLFGTSEIFKILLYRSPKPVLIKETVES